MIWVLRHISTKRLYRAEYAIQNNTSNMHKVLYVCTAIKMRKVGHVVVGWLVGCFGLNDPLRQYVSLYRAVSQREGGRKEKR